jgi:Flp pilus assembly protein TadD
MNIRNAMKEQVLQEELRRQLPQSRDPSSLPLQQNSGTIQRRDPRLDALQALADRDNDRMLVKSAEAAHRVGDLPQALSRYGSALEVNNKNAEAYFMRGVALHDMGRIFEAVPFYQKAIELNPKHANVSD